MELKATLKAPYAEEAKYQFIIKYNYNNGYDLKFYDTKIEAWGYTKEEEEERRKEQIKELLPSLTCTKRVLVLMLEQLGKDYFEEIEPLIKNNRQAKLEWELCVEVKRDNPLVNIIGEELNINEDQIDKLFLYANGIVNKLEV